MIRVAFPLQLLLFPPLCYSHHPQQRGDDKMADEKGDFKDWLEKQVEGQRKA